MKLLLMGVVACAVLAGVRVCGTEPAQNPDKRYEVTIAIDEASVKSHRENMETPPIAVNTKVKNTSGQDQKITVWTQQGWSWKSSTPDVEPSTMADKSISTMKLLHPGETFEGRVDVWVLHHKKGPIKFKLGFYPNPTGAISDREFKDLAGLYWSNEVVFKP